MKQVSFSFTCICIHWNKLGSDGSHSNNFISTAPSSAPVDFQAAASNPTSISLSWDPPVIEDQNGIIRHYEVTLIALETGEIHIRTSTALFITVTSLRPYTTYNCTVAAETVATGPSVIGILVQTPQTGIYIYYIINTQTY